MLEQKTEMEENLKCIGYKVLDIELTWPRLLCAFPEKVAFKLRLGKQAGVD